MNTPFETTASAEHRRGWRVGHRGRDQMYYEERHGGSWDRIEISGEMLMGPAHHVIYFATPSQWLQYPVWARHRRDEIIARIKSEFRPPDYEYHGDQPGEAPPTAEPVESPPRPAPERASPRSPQGRGALLLAVLLLLTLAAGMGWIVARGVTRGETRLPIRQASLRRPVPRQQEPATFWLAIGVYAALGAGALTLGLLGAREWRRMGG